DRAGEWAGEQVEGVGVDVVVGRGRAGGNGDVARCGQRRRDGQVLLRLQSVREQVAEPLVWREHARLEILVDQRGRRTIQGDQDNLRRCQQVPLLELEHFQLGGPRPAPLRGRGLRAEGLSDFPPPSTEVLHRCSSYTKSFLSLSSTVPACIARGQE